MTVDISCHMYYMFQYYMATFSLKMKLICLSFSFEIGTVWVDLNVM